MWNRVGIAVAVLVLACGSLRAQEFLGKTRAEIGKFVAGNSSRQLDYTEEGDTVTFRYEEEDERMRLFRVTCRFVFTDGVCLCYRKIVPVHEYWAGTIADAAVQQKAGGEGEKIDVDGLWLFPLYRFDGHTMSLAVEPDGLVMEFRLSGE